MEGREKLSVLTMVNFSEYAVLYSLKQKEARMIKRERQISGILAKVMEDFDKTFKARERVTDQREKLETRLMEQEGRITKLERKKKVVRDKKSVYERAIELLLAGKEAEAKKLVGKA